MSKPPPPNPLTIEQRSAAAIASLREGWHLAKESGLDKLTDAKIDAEIAEVRTELLRRRQSSASPLNQLTANR